MDQMQETNTSVLKIIFAAELLSKLTPEQQEQIIVQIESLLLHE